MAMMVGGIMQKDEATGTKLDGLYSQK